MSIFIVLLSILGFLFLCVCLVGYSMPNTWTIEEAVLLRARPNHLFALLNSLDKWPEWSFWSVDNGYRARFGSVKEGVGATMQLETNKVRISLSVSYTDTKNELRYQLKTANSLFVVEGILLISPSNTEYTQLAWRNSFIKYQGNHPIHRYQIYFLKKYI